MRPVSLNSSVEFPTFPVGVVPSPFDAVPRYTLYPARSDPPVDDGACHLRSICPFPAWAERFRGADGGTMDVVADVLASLETSDSPTEFTAVTL